MSETTAASIQFDRDDAGNGRDKVLWGLLIVAVVLVLAKALGILPEWINRLPDTIIPPAAEVLDVVFAFVQNDLGLIHITRFIAEGPLEFMLDTTANLLYGKRRWPFLGSVVAGYPDLDPRDRECFPREFWKLHHREVKRLEGA